MPIDSRHVGPDRTRQDTRHGAHLRLQINNLLLQRVPPRLHAPQSVMAANAGRHSSCCSLGAPRAAWEKGGEWNLLGKELGFPALWLASPADRRVELCTREPRPAVQRVTC
jgi:hypothetical protein